ncbi:MAG: crotonase/enoyl-CoA hydratase family protein [Myxococcota bacterium]
MSGYSFSCAAVTKLDGVAEVALTAAGKGQRMGPDYWEQLPALFAQLDADDEVRAVLLHTPAEHFSYGLDLVAMGAELAEFTAPDAGAAVRTRLLAQIKKMQHTHDAVARCRKPVLAAIAGWCIGGGVDLIAACDIRLAASNARFSVREVKLAIVPDVGTLARLPAIVGQGAARELALTGDDFDAARAKELGLVTHLFDSPAALLEAARAMARRLAKNPPLTVQGIKQVMNFSSEREASLSLDAVALWNSAFFPSEDLQEAIASFIEKREPVFKGR